MSIDTYTNLMETFFNSTRVHSDNYNMSIVAEWFHAIPHLDIKLKQIKNVTFDPNDNEYLESLGILVALPGFWLILTLLFFLIFFLCRCCDANTKKRKKLTFCKLSLFIFALIACVIIAGGMFGSWLSHSGIVKVQKSTQNASDLVSDVKDVSYETNTVLDRVNKDIDELLKLSDTRSSYIRNGTVKKLQIDSLYSAKRYLTKGIKKITEVNGKVAKYSDDVEMVPETIEKAENIRWPATFALLGILAFVCLILVWGVLRHSRCVLILFSVLGLLSLVICWVITSVYLGICVAGSDFCVDPQPFIQKQLSGVDDEMRNIVNYYLKCDTRNPLEDMLMDADDAVNGVDKSIREFEVHCLVPDRCPSEVNGLINSVNLHLNRTDYLMKSVKDLIKCDIIHGDYIDTLSASCKDILEGIAIMLFSAAASGFCFTILVLCASHTWINIRKKRPLPSEPTDETDPFLPPASSSSTASSTNCRRMRDPYGSSSSGRPRQYSHTPPQTPHFPPPSSTPPSATNGRSVGRDDHLSFLSPPPAYDHIGPVLQGQHHSHHQAVGPHYVADSDLMMRATQSTKF